MELPIKTADSPEKTLAAHRLAANCFVASVGTIGNRVSVSELEHLASMLSEEYVLRDNLSIFEVWSEAIANARSVLKTDSISQRLNRSAQLASDLIPLGIRAGLTQVTLLGGDFGALPLPFSAPTSDNTIGRCK